jgi:hypothetical protein
MLWQILWVLAALATAAVMFGAWTGPHRSVSNLSRWAMQLRIRPVPAWLSNRDADRWAFRGGLAAIALLLLLLLLVLSLLLPSQELPQAPAAIPATSNEPVAPDASPSARHIDTELKNAILVHVPKTKRIRMVVLKDDAEADQFSWEIDTFLRTEGYTVVAPRLMFAMSKGEPTPSGTAIYPDQKDQDVVVIRIGLNDRK